MTIGRKKALLRRIGGSVAGLKPPVIVHRPLTKESFLRPAELRRFRNLLFAARTIVEGCYAGRHRSPFRGHSVEFADYREYCPGDDIQDIDWKAYGRTDRLFVKLFEARTDMVVYALLDCSASMGYAGLERADTGRGPRAGPAASGLSKLQYACYLLAALAFLVVKQGDKIALGLFRDRLFEYVPPGGTFGHLYGILSRLETVVPSGPTRPAEVLRQAFGTVKRRGLLILVGDLMEEPAALFEALNLYRHRRFEIIVFQVLHPDELSLPAAANVRFIDSETNDSITTSVPDIREDYEQRMRRHLEAIRAGCAARRIDYNLVTTETSCYDALEQYVVARAAGGVRSDA